jgi:hypothetical protein
MERTNKILIYWKIMEKQREFYAVLEIMQPT